MRDRPADLIKGLFKIGRDREDVTEVAHRHLLAQIDPDLEIIWRVERGNPPDGLWAEACTRAKGRAAIERYAEDRRVVLSGIVYVLEIGRLQERVDPGIMRQFAPCESRDAAVFDALRPGQPHPDRPFPLGLPAGLRQLCLPMDRP